MENFDTVSNVNSIDYVISWKGTNFIKNNKDWDNYKDSIDKDGLVLYQNDPWRDRVCTSNTLQRVNIEVHDTIRIIIHRLKLIVESKFNIIAEDTGAAMVRWPVGARQEPHADKEFWIGSEAGRPNSFPFYDLGSLFYLNSDKIILVGNRSADKNLSQIIYFILIYSCMSFMHENIFNISSCKILGNDT